jgi:hypothetical protein
LATEPSGSAGRNYIKIGPTLPLTKWCEMKYETMTCNGKAISKVMEWGMILNMIRDRNGTQETGDRW